MTETAVATQQSAVPMNADIDLIKSQYAKGATDNELNLLLYYANKYHLDIMSRQIWFVKFVGQPAQIYAGRDGYLAVAHRSGHFDGMQTDVQKDEKGNVISATCKVWRNDMSHPFEQTVLFKEYNTGKSIWLSKPATMIAKVAESQALRKAFDISGLYDPCEMGDEGERAMKIQPMASDIDVTPANSIDYSKCYPQDQFDTVVMQYQAKGWDTDSLKACKVADGWYDKEKVNADFQQHVAEEKAKQEQTFVMPEIKLTEKKPATSKQEKL